MTGGENWHINLMNAVPGSTAVDWFNDRNFFADNSDLGEAVLSRDGRRLAG